MSTIRPSQMGERKAIGSHQAYSLLPINILRISPAMATPRAARAIPQSRKEMRLDRRRSIALYSLVSRCFTSGWKCSDHIHPISPLQFLIRNNIKLMFPCRPEGLWGRSEHWSCDHLSVGWDVGFALGCPGGWWTFPETILGPNGGSVFH